MFLIPIATILSIINNLMWNYNDHYDSGPFCLDFVNWFWEYTKKLLYLIILDKKCTLRKTSKHKQLEYTSLMVTNKAFTMINQQSQQNNEFTKQITYSADFIKVMNIANKLYSLIVRMWNQLFLFLRNLPIKMVTINKGC